MATVVGMTADAIEALVSTLVTGGTIDGSGNLSLTLKDGSTVPVGNVAASVPSASETIAGILKIATSAQITAGSDDATAVSPSHLASALSPINSEIAVNTANITSNTTNLGLKQSFSAYLNQISLLTPSNGDVIQLEAGAWTHRTPTQLAADILAVGNMLNSLLYNGSAYAATTNTHVYVGATDPSTLGTVTDGAVWFDTSGG